MKVFSSEGERLRTDGREAVFADTVVQRIFYLNVSIDPGPEDRMDFSVEDHRPDNGGVQSY